MSSNRITREDIIRLKLKKKKYIRKITMLVVACVLVLTGVVIFVVHKVKKPKEEPKGKQIDIGISADIGVGNMSKIDYTFVMQLADAQRQEQEEEEYLNSIEFTVPETSLPKIEEVEGNNWYDESYYNKEENGLVALKYFSNSVFIGDSRTEGLLLYSGLPNLNGFCYKGLSVDKLNSEANIYVEGYSDKYTCYDAISMTSYDNYYCSFGVNELGWVSIDIFIEDFNDMLDHIREVNPDAVIYVQSILPVSKSVSEDSDIYKKERIDEFNARLLQMCQERKDVIYLDVASAVMDEEGYLPDEASPDGIHCNADYCKRIIQYIRQNTYTKK